MFFSKSSILVALKLAYVAVLIQTASSGYHFGCEWHREPFTVELSLVPCVKHDILQDGQTISSGWHCATRGSFVVRRIYFH
uniref:Secreted protein n=1 Tax=Rhipicephalus appendiculatus TaxID=34631 RepID=A0A131YCK6_RHIAP